MRGTRSLAMLAGLFFGTAGDPEAAVKTGTIQGTVRETGIGGGPLAGAIVMVQGTTLRTLTDRAGRYELANVPVGRHQLAVNYVGFAQSIRTVEVQAGQSVTADFALSQPALRMDEMTLGKVVPLAAPREGKIAATRGVAARSADAAVYYAPVPPSFNRRAEFNTEEYRYQADNGWQSSVRQPLSTFSIDVDAGSYSNVRRFIREGRLPPKDAVRVEEMINYFRYDYPAPHGEHPFSVTTELSAAPWSPGHRLAMIGLQSQRLKLGDLPPNNLVFLIDVSGSMDEPNKLPLVKSAFRLLVNELRAEDRVSIVVYAGAAGLVLPPTRGSDKERILDAIEQLQAGGSTAGGAGIQLAYQTARESFQKEGNNRVILATDGDFNVGASSEGELVRMIEQRKKDGVFLTVLGFGTGNLKDARMEQLANKGNGHYAYVDDLLEAKKVFVQELGATLYTIAKDVKLQVEFNPARVKSYRLIGYENRLLADRDFNDDTKDAGDMGAGHSVTALYEIVPADGPADNDGAVDPLTYQHGVRPTGSSDWFTVKVRYKPPQSEQSRLLQQAVRTETSSPSTDFRFATSVAEFGMLLRDSEYKGQASYADVLSRARAARGGDEEGYRAEFLRLVEMASTLTRNGKGISGR